jgi:hypothetical protein
MAGVLQAFAAVRHIYAGIAKTQPAPAEFCMRLLHTGPPKSCGLTRHDLDADPEP